MQKFPLRNRCNPPSNNSLGCGNPARGRDNSLNGGIQRTCHSMPPATARQMLTKKPATVRICSQVYSKDSDNLATWDEVLSEGGKSKSVSPASSSLVDTNAVTGPPPATKTTTQEPVQQTSAGILGVPSNATASTKNNNTNTNLNLNNNNAKGNRNKDDDDNNCRQQRITEAPPAAASAASAAAVAAMPAATAREFMTFERLRLGDQINFLLFDPYRTLKFLITELKSRLRTVVPDDINVHKILVEIQQTMKRIRIPNATETSVPLQAPRMVKTTARPEVPGAAVQCIFPEERCHVIEKDPLINHARKVNSSCQTIASQLENVNACQMCEHQVKQGTAGCNQKRMNGNSNAEDVMVEMDGTEPHQRSKDHKRNTEVKKRFSYKTLQDAIEMLRNKSNPFSDDTQKIITQLETELISFQRELQKTFPSSSSSSTACRRPSKENSKVQCKRLADEEENADEEGEEEQEEDERSGQDDEDEEETFPDFNAARSRRHSVDDKKVKSTNQMKVKNPAQMLCHLEKEKLLLLQQFRASEMDNIQGDLGELHAFIKDQLDGIYHSITQETLNVKYHSSDRRAFRSRKNRPKNQPGAERKTPTPELPSTSSLLTALTSSPSSNEMQREVRETSPESSLPGHYKKSSSPNPNCNGAGDGNANNTNNTIKSMTKHKHTLSLASSASGADTTREPHNIDDVDKVNKTLGEMKKSKGHHPRHDVDQFFDQHHLFNRAKYCAPIFEDTPFCREKRIHFSALECDGCCCNPHNSIADRVRRIMTADAARPSPAHADIKSTNKTSLAAMTCHQHCQQCHQQPPTTSAAQEQAQLISSSLPAGLSPRPRVPPSCTTATAQSEVDETALNLDAVTNAAVRNIIQKAYATAAEHSNGIRMHRHHQCASYKAPNTWQCVNLKNPAACQLKKQICGDEYECRINNNGTSANDNRSKHAEIHDCQKCRANNINPFGGLCSAKMHEVGADNVAAAAAAAATACDGGDRNDADADAGGDGPIYWNEGTRAAALGGDFTCHTGQRKHAGAKSPARRPTAAAKATLQTDLEEFKEFLDEMIHSTPRLK